eukprot:gene26579-biopygen16922
MLGGSGGVGKLCGASPHTTSPQPLPWSIAPPHVEWGLVPPTLTMD